MKSIKFGYHRYVPWLSASFFFLFYSSFVLQAIGQASLPFDLNSFTVLSKPSDKDLRLNEINSHAARHFGKHFTSVLTEKWIKTDDYYIASFLESGTPSKAYYDLKGRFKFYIKSYSVEKLQKDVASLISKQFSGYKIDVVTEISTLEEHFYIIKIKNDSNIKTLKVAEGNIEVIEDFVNAGL